MPETNSPLSYQTTMPEYPDVSYKAYQAETGYSGQSRFDTWIGNLWDGNASYDTWRTNLLDQYNAQLGAYNTWLETGEGIRASAESGGYNPSYFNGNAPSASPLSYQDVNESTGLSELGQGISGIFKFAQAFMQVKAMASQIAGQELKNKAQDINNQYLGKLLGLKADNLTFQADKRQFDLEQLFYPRWSTKPELWKGGVFSPYGRGTYDLEGAERSLGYQRAVTDLDYLKAGKILRQSQNDLVKASKREKDWYFDNVNSVMLSMMQHSEKILKGEYDFQQTEQQLRKAGIIANISVGVINAAVNAIKAFMPGVSSGLGSLAGGTLPGPTQFPSLGAGNGGMDFSGFGSFSPYD